LTLELEQGVFHSQHEYLALVPFFLAEALDLEGQRLDYFGQVLDARLQFLDVVPVLLRFAGEKKKLADVFKESPQHG